MAKVICSTKDMSREDWLVVRSNYIGGSDASIVLGVNKYKTAFELWLEKTNQVIPKEIDNEAIHFGNVLEDVVASEFMRRTGKRVRKINQMLQHDEHSFMMANLDRVVIGEKALLECKTASEYLKGEWAGDEIPAAYLIQINHYLAVTGFEKAYIACLIGGNKFVWKEINRDEELINIIIEQEKHFWDFHVNGSNPPALDGSSAAEQYLKEVYPRANKGKVIDLRVEHKENIESYLSLKEQKAILDEEIKRVENLLKYDLGDSESGMIQKYIVNWKNVSSNRVDSKLLKEKYPEIAAEVTKTSNSRRFEIKEVKE
jgi:putative phage-type endonuclease